MDISIDWHVKFNCTLIPIVSYVRNGENSWEISYRCQLEDFEENCVTGCNAVQSGKRVPKFQKILLPPLTR